MRVVEMTQGTPEWHAWRLGGIGGSDAPVLDGTSPYRTRRELFREKHLKLVVEDPTKEFIFSKGHKTEGLIRKEFAELTGVEMRPICVNHGEFDHVRASLDGYDGMLGVLEAKLVGQAVLDAARSGEIPAHHMTQMQHQFAATGADLGQWFGHDGKRGGILIAVHRDEEFIKRLLDQEHEFWRMVQEGREPPLSPEDYLEPQDLSPLLELRDAKEAADNAKAFYDQVRERVLGTFQHPKIAGAGLKVFQVTKSGSIDYKSIPEIQALAPEYLEKFRGKPSTSWTVTIEKQKKGNQS